MTSQHLRWQPISKPLAIVGLALATGLLCAGCSSGTSSTDDVPKKQGTVEIKQADPNAKSPEQRHKERSTAGGDAGV